jgi:hypothetical protein
MGEKSSKRKVFKYRKNTYSSEILREEKVQKKINLNKMQTT